MVKEKFTAVQLLTERPALISEETFARLKDVRKGGRKQANYENMRKLANDLGIPNDSLARTTMLHLYDFFGELDVPLRRALVVKKMGIAPGVTVPIPYARGKTGIVKEVHRDFQFTLEGERGRFSPIGLEDRD